MLLNQDRLHYLTKPLELFIDEDVNAGIVLQYQAMEEWKKHGLYYVAELLTGECSVSFLPVYKALHDFGFTEDMLSPLLGKLPKIAFGDGIDSTKLYEELKPEIEDLLCDEITLWLHQESIEQELRDTLAPLTEKTLNIHIQEQDLLSVGIDMDTAQDILKDPKFNKEFSDLLKRYARYTQATQA